MSHPQSLAEIKALTGAMISHGKTGNMRAVVQILEEIEKKTKSFKNEPQIEASLAEAYRHALEPFGVARKFKEIEQLLDKIEHILRSDSSSENLQEIYSEALNATIFHYVMNEMNKDIHRTLSKLGSFAGKHQIHPFVQFNYATSLSKVAEYFAEIDDKEASLKILWEIIGIVTFFPGKEILTQVAQGLVYSITVAGMKLNLSELEDLATRIDEFINFTNDFDIQQKLTACQGKIFQFIAGQRMREGYSPDGKLHTKYKKQ